MSGTAASMILECEARQQVLVVVPEVADNELILAPSASASLLASGEVNAFNCRRITVTAKSGAATAWKPISTSAPYFANSADADSCASLC